MSEGTKNDPKRLRAILADIRVRFSKVAMGIAGYGTQYQPFHHHCCVNSQHNSAAKY